MNFNNIKFEWKKTKKIIQDKWNKFTDDDLDKIDGKIENLEKQLMLKYNITKEEAKKEIDNFNKEVKDDVTIIGYEVKDKINDIEDDIEILKYEASDKLKNKN